jgi:capsular polysaccharide biosynthesis protein
MIDLSWTIGEEREAELTEAPRPVLSTWHYLRSSLRRGWRTWVGLTVLGAVLGLAVVLVTPPGSTAKVTLLMGHPPSIDGPDGIAMDVSLLNTRAVSERTVEALGLALTPEAFRSAITADPVTSEVLSITVAGPDEAAAAARANELVRQYLDFRATQLRSMTSGLRTQYSSRITSAQQQVTALTKQFEQLSSQGAAAQSRAYDTLARRTDLNKQIADWQEAVDNATLYTDAALQTTHVIDPVQVDRASVKRAMALAVGSGLTAGAALGVGIVLFRALVTARLRRRQDVGVALGASVRFSVRSRGPAGRGGLRRWLPTRGRWRGNDLATLARGLESALDPRAGMPGPAAAVPVEAPVTAAPNGRRSTAVSGQLSGS